MAAQNREKDETLDLQVPVESSLSLSTATTTTSGCGSIGPGRAEPDAARVDREEEAERRSAEDSTGPVQNTEERKRTATDSGSGNEPAKRSVNRCSGCRKRVGLTGFRCRCGDLFCSEHRYTDRHECSYDYKAAGRAAIARENPVVRAAKILKVVEEVVEKVGFKERDKSVRDEVKRRGHYSDRRRKTVKEIRYFEDREIKLREDIYEQKVRDEKEEEVVKPSRRRVMEMDENRRASTVHCCQVHCTSSKPASCSRVCCFGAAYHYMLEQPTDDSVQIAVDFDKECGCILQHLCLKGLHGIFERFRGILHKGEIDKRFSFRLRAYLPSEKLISGFMSGFSFVNLGNRTYLWRDDEIDPEPSLGKRERLNIEEVRKVFVAVLFEQVFQSGHDDVLRRDNGKAKGLIPKRDPMLDFMFCWERFCMINTVHQENFKNRFVVQYSMVRLETNKGGHDFLIAYLHQDPFPDNLREYLKNMPQMIMQQANNRSQSQRMLFQVLRIQNLHVPNQILTPQVLMRVNEDRHRKRKKKRTVYSIESIQGMQDFCSESYLEHLGIRSLNEWHNNPLMSDLYESNFLKDNPSNACHDGLPSTSSTSMIGSGGLAKNLRDDRYNMPQMIMQQQKAKQEDGSDGSGSISSGTLCCV
ncbi:hypothetical protein KSS87_006965 [Heliosperma pusillum]|nr:hypothetical protein KSS87_006965 [Heliosperma pusillum]